MFRTDYCGYNVHNPDRDIIFRPSGRGDYLFLHLTCDMDFYFPMHTDTQKENNKDAHEVKSVKTESYREIVYRDGEKFVKRIAHPGDCILFAPGMLHYYQARRKFSNSFVHFTCNPDEIQGMQIPMNEIFHPSDDEKIVDILRRLQIEYLSKQIRRERMIDLLIRELLIESERSLFITDEEMIQPGIYAQLNRFRIHMLQNCSKEWSIEMICRQTGLGRSQLYHYYKTFFFTSPKEDLIHARIDKAKHLLTNQELRILDVAQQSGFQNIYHFNRLFKRECAMTPGQYREKLRRKVNVNRADF